MRHFKIDNENSNWEKELNQFNSNYKKGKWFVKIYANWCGHCQNMKPEWEKLKNENDFFRRNDINIVEIEESKLNDRTNQLHQSRGFPTLIYYHDGEKIDYDGEDRTKQSFINFLKRYNEESRIGGGYKKRNNKSHKKNKRYYKKTNKKYNQTKHKKNNYRKKSVRNINKK